MKKVKYGNRVARVTAAAGVCGTLCRSIGGTYFFRVYKTSRRFADYELRHDDLQVTIAADELASFYRVNGRGFLDHSPDVLGLSRPRTGEYFSAEGVLRELGKRLSVRKTKKTKKRK